MTQAMASPGTKLHRLRRCVIQRIISWYRHQLVCPDLLAQLSDWCDRVRLWPQDRLRL